MSEYSRSITITISPAEVQQLRNAVDIPLRSSELGDINDDFTIDDLLTANAVVNRMERAVARLLWDETADNYDWPVREFSCDEINER